MTKNDFIKNIAAEVGLTKREVDAVLDAMEKVIRETLAENHDERIPFGGLGAFKTKAFEAKDGVCGFSGEVWHKDAHRDIIFSESKSCKNI